MSPPPALRVTPHGAAGGVTGSAYLVETGRARVLVDCGLFQGEGASDERNADLRALDPKRIDAVVLTHAHIDHSGRLPLLARAGYRRKVFATPATVDLATLLLEDSARIQEGDALRASRIRRRAGLPPVEPLYGTKDVARVARLFRGLRYDTAQRIAPGVTLRFFDAGHILGSASAELAIEAPEGGRTVVFSGDVGSPGMPILRDPVPPRRADLVFLESTYGDRDHPKRSESVRELVGILRSAVKRRQRVLVPAFAVGRTQLMLYYVAEAVRAGRIPGDFRIYLDSPAGTRATRVYLRHQELYDEETAGLARGGQLARDLRGLRVLDTVQQSMALNESEEPCVILAGSGMCDGGRIQHHLKHHLWRPGAAVVIAGYMASGTLGRRLADGEKEVPVLGETIAVRAHVHVLSGFSAHAGKSELGDWLREVAPAKPRVALTHGEDGPREGLRAALRERFGLDAACPAEGETLTLD